MLHVSSSFHVHCNALHNPTIAHGMTISSPYLMWIEHVLDSLAILKASSPQFFTIGNHLLGQMCESGLEARNGRCVSKGLGKAIIHKNICIQAATIQPIFADCFASARI